MSGELINVKRRDLLKQIGTAIVPIGSSGVALAGSKRVGEEQALYSEITVQFDNVPDAPAIDVDSIAGTKINPQRAQIAPQQIGHHRASNSQQASLGRQRSGAPPGLEKKLKSGNHVIKCNGYSVPPFSAFNNGRTKSLNVRNKRRIKAASPIELPTIKVRDTADDDTVARVKGREFTVEPHKVVEAQLSDVEAEFDVFGEYKKMDDPRGDGKISAREVNRGVTRQVTPKVRIINCGGFTPVSESTLEENR